MQVCLQLKIREVRQKMMARPSSPGSSANTASAPGTPLSAPPVSSSAAGLARLGHHQAAAVAVERDK